MKSVILIGGGWSIKEGIEKGLWDKIKGQEIWSLNYAFKTMPYLPTRELWVDFTFFKHNIQDLQILNQQGVEIYAKEHKKYAFIKPIKQYQCTRDMKDIQSIFIGKQGFVGLFALTLAIKENYDIIYLLGYDYGTPDIKNSFTHYYQNKLNVYSTGINHPELYRKKDNKLNRGIEDFNYYKQFNKQIYNISLQSNIEIFPKLSWEDFFIKIKQ